MIIDFVFSLTLNNICCTYYCSSLASLPGGGHECLTGGSLGSVVHEGEVWWGTGGENHRSEGAFSDNLFTGLVFTDNLELNGELEVRDRDVEFSVPDGLLGLLKDGGLVFEGLFGAFDSEEDRLLDHDGAVSLLNFDGESSGLLGHGLLEHLGGGSLSGLDLILVLSDLTLSLDSSGDAGFVLIRLLLDCGSLLRGEGFVGSGRGVLLLFGGSSVRLGHLIDPLSRVVTPLAKLGFVEPEGDLVVGSLNGVRSVDDVTSNINTHISTDGSGEGVLGVGGSEHEAASGDGVVSFPDHGTDGAGDHVVNERGEEFLGGKISVVLFHVLSSGGTDLHGDELEALLLKSHHDLADESSLDGIGLEHNEGTFSGH